MLDRNTLRFKKDLALFFSVTAGKNKTKTWWRRRGGATGPDNSRKLLLAKPINSWK